MLRRSARIVALLTVFILMTGCSLLPSGSRSRSSPQTLSGPTPTPIPTPIVPTKPVYEVKQGEVIEKVEFSGRVAPVVEEELFFRTAGRVRTVYIERDDMVTEGQVLADLEIDDLERELASTLLELERAEQQLDEAEQAHTDALARAQLRLELAESKLSKADQDRAFDLAKAQMDLTVKQLELQKFRNQDLEARQILAKADLDKAEISLQQAQRDYDKIAYGDSVGSSPQAVRLQQATIDYERARAGYQLAIEDVENYEIDERLKQQQLALAQMNLEELQADGLDPELVRDLALAKLDVDILERGIDPVYRNNVERARLNVQKLEAAIADAQIIAPFDGQVLSISLTEGRDVTTYKPVVIVANLNELEITADPIDSQLSDLTEGMPVTAWLSSRPGETFNGIIRRLPYPYGGGGRSDGVENEDTSTRITLEQSPQELDLERGDIVRLEVVLEEKDNVLWLPPQAIRTFDGRRFVVVQDDDAQRRVDVKIGIEGEDRVEIEEGLELGQVIVGQ